MFRIEPRVQGATPELLEMYREISPSTLGHLTDFGFMKGLRPLFRPIRLLGNAVTVRIPHIDATAIRHALELAEPGDVLVVDMSGDDERACWGEFRTYAALDKKLAGAVVSGCVADARAISALGFPVYSAGISALTTRSLELQGEVNVPIAMRGVSVQPGDLIVGDDDGVFAVGPRQAEPLGLAALEKQRKEAKRRRELGYGEPSV
ncbi:RraA family protein [Paenibacillaceae bacterium WGS1546]|uniref:RraA family protein n=1 Tax=Cohnella sp. WGS1546 TaxID=3366810 RepID=UPI00372D0664